MTEPSPQDTTASLPQVSILLPMRNEESHISQCLDSILQNDYPKDRIEILVIDGESTDRSQEIIKDYVDRYQFIRLLKNPKLIQAAALNIGIREAKGDIVIRMDAHTTYATDYVYECVKALLNEDTINVGGKLEAIGTGYVRRAISVVLMHPFATGSPEYRHSDREALVETVYLGAWRRQTLEAIGGFNEGMVCSEDCELNFRLRKLGGRILYRPQIRCQYTVKFSMRSLARYYFWGGFWKVKALVAHPESLRMRQLAPISLILTLMISLSLVPVVGLAGTTIAGLYALANVAASIHAATRNGWRYLPLLPCIFPVVHFSYGVGSLVGMFRFATRLIARGAVTESRR